MTHPIVALVNLIKEKASPNMQVAEIGCWKGDTTKHYIDTIRENNGHLYLVDWFSGSHTNHDPNHIHHWQPDTTDLVVQDLKNNLNNLDSVTILKGKSQDMAQYIPDASLDICFIDADHHYLAVKQDIKDYLPKVKPGGILCGHDCGLLGSANPCDVLYLAPTFTPAQLQEEYIQLTPHTGCHPGVIRAVWEAFGNVEIRPDPGYHGIPIWIYHLASLSNQPE